MPQIEFYLVTIRKSQVKDYVSFEKLTAIVEILVRHFGDEFIIRDYCHEAHGRYKQLHTHMLVETKPGFRYSKYTKILPGFIIHFRRWLSWPWDAVQYIHKHCCNHCPAQIEQTRQCNYYRYHYAF